MCVVSMVHDHYRPLIPDVAPLGGITWPPPPAIDLDRLEKLINEYKQAVEAAKTVDKLTGQADCEDPEKAKLTARVAELERVIAKMKPKRKKRRTRAGRR